MGLLQRIKHLAGGESRTDATSQSASGVDRRRHRRTQSSKLTIFICNKRYKTNDWSLGGFRIVVPGSEFIINQCINGAIHGPGMFDRGEYEASISWVGDNGEIGAHFIELSHESFLAMSAAQV
jgi:hypothetical protein